LKEVEKQTIIEKDKIDKQREKLKKEAFEEMQKEQKKFKNNKDMLD